MKLRHLVIVVPGILGSVLESPNGRPIWGQSRAVLAKALWHPERLSVTTHPRLAATGLLGSMTVLPPLPWGGAGYDGLVTAIRNTFSGVRFDVARPGAKRDLNADLVAFPYDFRLGVEHAANQLAAEVAARLAGLTPSARHRRVIVVAHSLGAVVARYWAGPLAGGDTCQALLTLGAPHRGAPKALDWLVNGVRVAGLRLDEVSEVVAGWPSAYDLLPRYPAIWDDGAGSAIYPHDLTDVAGASIPACFATAAKAAYGMHQGIEAAWTDEPQRGSMPDLVALFARGHATPAAAHLTDGRLTVSKQDASWLPNLGWGGDATVPAISAIPIELEEARHSWLAVPQRHTALPDSPAVVEILKSYAGESMVAVRGEAPEQPWLGVDLDEAALAGQPVPVRARLHGVPAETTAMVRVSACSDIDGRPVGAVQLEQAEDGGFAGELAPLPPGGYRILVQADPIDLGADTAAIDRVTCEDVLAVVDPEPDPDGDPLLV